MIDPATLAAVDQAIRDALPARMAYDVDLPIGLTTTTWQVAALTPSGKRMSPEAVGQALVTLVDQGGATKLTKVEAHENERGGAVAFVVRGWKA
jgi:hypothetical protein